MGIRDHTSHKVLRLRRVGLFRNYSLEAFSGYGKASFEFAQGKPIELLSGSNLLYLLAEYAGIEAKIEVPDYWKDPQPDSSDE